MVILFCFTNDSKENGESFSEWLFPQSASHDREDLLEKIFNGDRASLTTLLRKHQQRLLGDFKVIPSTASWDIRLVEGNLMPVLKCSTLSCPILATDSMSIPDPDHLECGDGGAWIIALDDYVLILNINRQCDRVSSRFKCSRSRWRELWLKFGLFPRKISAGTGTVIARHMKESDSLDVAGLRTELARSGYLLLRGLLPRAAVLAARSRVLKEMDCFLAPEAPLLQARAFDASLSPQLLRRQDIAGLPEVKAVLEHPSLGAWLAAFFGEPVTTAAYKWLRAVGRGKFTGVHMDRVYLGQGSDALLTCWIPLGDIPVHQGTLLVSEGSQGRPDLAALRAGYGHSSVGRDGVASGWLTDDPSTLTDAYGDLKWVTADFAMGDVCVIGLDVLHMSTTNTTECYRLSCDTRWQPAAHPLDPRLARSLATFPPKEMRVGTFRKRKRQKMMKKGEK